MNSGAIMAHVVDLDTSCSSTEGCLRLILPLFPDDKYYHNCATVNYQGQLGILAHIFHTNYHPQKSGLKFVVKRS